MSPIWTYKQFPEIKALAKAEQSKAWRAIMKKSSGDKAMFKARFIQLFILISSVLLAIRLGDNIVYPYNILVSATAGALGGSLSAVVYLTMIRIPVQKYIDAYFDDADNKPPKLPL